MNKNQIQKITGVLNNYKGQDVCLSSWNIVDDTQDSYKQDVFTVGDVLVNNETMSIIDDYDKRVVYEFKMDKIQDIYLNKLNICLDSDAEVHIVFSHLGERFDFINLM